MAKIVTVGEIMLELSDLGDGLYRKSFAGDTFNLAHYLVATVGGAHEIEYLTALGLDEDSEQCLSFMRARGVGVSACVRDPERTIGLFLLANDARGEKRYGYWRGQSAARGLFEVRRDLSGYDWVCFSGITAAVCHHRENLKASVFHAQRRGARLVYDCNHRPLLWSAADARVFAEGVLSGVAMVKISDEELALLFPGDTVQGLSESYPDAEWVLTCEGQTSEAWQNGVPLARWVCAPAGTIAADTSGAGDAFLAAYLAARIAGAQPRDALGKGHEIAAQVVGVKGSVVDVTV